MSTKVLVTGANGQMGKTLKELFDHNHDGIEFTFVTKSQLDITDIDSLETYFERQTFDYCINCAAYTKVEDAEEFIEEAFKINAYAVGHLSEYCKNSSTRLIHISTDYVFDGKKGEPYAETDQTNPINQYGHSKLAGEKLIQESNEEYFIIRTSWLYSKHPKNFMTTIVSKIEDNADLTITTSQKGAPTSCIELSKFIYWLIQSKTKDFGIYHFSAIGEATWYDFAMRIAEHFRGYDLKKVSPSNNFKSKAERPEYSVMDNSKVQKKYHDQNHWKEDVDTIVMDIMTNR